MPEEKKRFYHKGPENFFLRIIRILIRKKKRKKRFRMQKSKSLKKPDQQVKNPAKMRLRRVFLKLISQPL